MYADDVWLIADCIVSLLIVCDNVGAVIEEYSLKVNEKESAVEKESKVVSINGVLGNRR